MSVEVPITVTSYPNTATHSPEVTRGTDAKKIVLVGGSNGIIARVRAVQPGGGTGGGGGSYTFAG